MTPETSAEDEPAVHIEANVPQMLQLRLVEEAHVREGLKQVSAALAEQQAKLRKLEGGGNPFAGLAKKFGKKEETPELRAAREEERRLARITRRVGDMARRLQEEIEALVDVHLAGLLPDYGTYRDARKKLQPWEQALRQFQDRVGRLVDHLGQARNMASSGYDKKRRMLSETAKGLLEKSIETAKGAVKAADAANEAAAGLGQVPRLNFRLQASDLVALEKLDVGAMQAEFDKIIKMLEAIQQTELETLKASGLGEAETKRQQAAVYLADYVQQLREHTDKNHFKADQVTPTIQRLETRYFTN